MIKMYPQAWDEFWRLVRRLIWLGVVVGLAIHFGLGGLSHADTAASTAVATIRGAMDHLAQSIPGA